MHRRDVRVPSLRERAEDVPLLAQRLLAQAAAEQGCREARRAAAASSQLRLGIPRSTLYLKLKRWGVRE
ncbi:MAG: hypothetical protein JNL90_12020 [Planctomycetes bacterium]|nr:hypothetical protein [Planctomycetota bacterium]